MYMHGHTNRIYTHIYTITNVDPMPFPLLLNATLRVLEKKQKMWGHTSFIYWILICLSLGIEMCVSMFQSNSKWLWHTVLCKHFVQFNYAISHHTLLQKSKAFKDTNLNIIALHKYCHLVVRWLLIWNWIQNGNAWTTSTGLFLPFVC